MAKKKKTDPDKTPPAAGENFDDLEDAFFATGDASSFWEKADPSQLDDDSQEVQLDDDSQEVDEITDVRNLIDPLAEPSESIAAKEGEPEVAPSQDPDPGLPPFISAPDAN